MDICFQDYKDYIMYRPTQYNEEDVYVCENLFDEAKRQIRPLPTGLKKYRVSAKVFVDEVYNFRVPLHPEKELLTPVTVPRAAASSPSFDINEDSMDAPPSIGSVEAPSPVTKVQPKKQDRKKLVTAYILFSADVRRITMEENPGVRFGEISRIVAERWRQMPETDKVVNSSFC